MKLSRPLTATESQRVETTLGTLQSAHAAFESKLRTLADASTAQSAADRQHEAARRDRLSSNAAQVREHYARQLRAANERADKAKGEMEAARRGVAVAIEGASSLIRTLCEPLLDQFRRGLVEALQPFCTDARRTVAAIEDTHSELPALQRFLYRGSHVSKVASAEEIEWFTFSLGQTLQSIHDGSEIWTPSRVGAPVGKI